MPRRPETAATLIARARQRYSVPTLPQGVVNQIGVLCTHNDSVDPAKVPIGWVLHALEGHGYRLSAAQLNAVCARDLGRYSFAHATDPNP